MLDSSLTRVVLAASVLFVVLVNGARSISAEPLEVVEYNVVHKFIGKGGEAARDLSGIACAPGDSAAVASSSTTRGTALSGPRSTERPLLPRTRSR